MAVEGVDYAWDRPSVSGLVSAGKRFVVRYGGPGSAGKQIDAAELRALRAAGIAVVANAEGTAQGFKGRTAGRAWAQDAEAYFRGLGMPGDRPIYFSADWDVPSSQYDDVDAALRGAAEVIGAARVGLYGGYNIIRHAQAAGTARWFWQTYAWSGGRWASGTHLQQYKNGVSLAGGTVDLNRAMTSDYGQWGAAGTPSGGVDDVWCNKGDSGENVKSLQVRLVNVGISVTVDGDYGPGTQAGLRSAILKVAPKSGADGSRFGSYEAWYLARLEHRTFSAADLADDLKAVGARIKAVEDKATALGGTAAKLTSDLKALADQVTALPTGGGGAIPAGDYVITGSIRPADSPQG